MSRSRRPRSSTVVRLATIGGASDRLRVALTALGAATAALLVLSALNVMLINGTGFDRYQSALLDEPGLRPGVIVTLLALTVPMVAFVGQCLRVGTPARNRRLAMLRMSGATSADVRRIAAVETVVAAAFGATCGGATFALGRALLPSQPNRFGLLPWPNDVPIPIVAYVGVVVVLAVASGLAANRALRRTSIDPTGVSRHQRERAPSVLPLALLIAGAFGLVIIAILARQGRSGAGPNAATLGGALMSFACCAAGLTLGPATVAQRLGEFVHRRTSSPALMIAGARLSITPFRASWSLGAVLIAVLIGSIVQQVRTAFLLATDPEDPFYASTFDLLNLALGVGLVIAALGLLVGAAEGIAERRRLFATLVALGTQRFVLAKAVLAETLIPLVPGSIVAVATGTLIARGFTGEEVEISEEVVGNATARVPVPWTELTALTVGALAAATAVTALSLALLPSSTSPSELRAAA